MAPSGPNRTENGHSLFIAGFYFQTPCFTGKGMIDVAFASPTGPAFYFQFSLLYVWLPLLNLSNSRQVYLRHFFSFHKII